MEEEQIAGKTVAAAVVADASEMVPSFEWGLSSGWHTSGNNANATSYTRIV